jgi:hypothetical protein
VTGALIILGAILSGALDAGVVPVPAEVARVAEPCGDEGLSPRPIPNARVWLVPGTAFSPDHAQIFTTDAQGHFPAPVMPGMYCARLEPVDLAWGASSGSVRLDPTCLKRQAKQCDTIFRVEDARGGAEVLVLRGCGDVCVQGDPTLPVTAKGIGRARAAGGTRHVRGSVTRSASWWSGVPPPPVDPRRAPDPGPGEGVLVRPGDLNRGAPSVAEVIADEGGAFDVALPPGTWCLVSGYRAANLFTHLQSSGPSEFDPACIRKNLATCDQVVHLGGHDVEGLRIHVHRWSPADEPCRIRPYSGPYPP